MKKLKINKKIVTIATYTIAILSAISFAIYPETNAIFKKDKENALVYISSLEDTYYGILNPTLNRNASTLNVARITLTLPRDLRYITDTDSDKYFIEATSVTPLNPAVKETACTIVKNTKSSNLNIDGDNFITFNDNNNGVIEIECNVEPNKVIPDNIMVNIKYYETINDEERFIFRNGSLSMKYSEYAEPYLEPAEDSIILIKNPDGSDKSSEDIYNEFIELIKKHIKDSGYKDYFITTNAQGKEVIDEIFINYIKDNNIISTTAKNILIDAPEFNLLGVTRAPSKNEDGSIKGYGFDFDENFIGYVKSYDFYSSNPNTSGNFVYFSTEDASKIEIALINTINKWAFKDNKNFIIGDESYTTKSLVLKYIDAYLKDRNLDYSFANIESIQPLYSELDDTNHKYIGFGASTIDYAYNYLAKDYGIIHVSYYNQYTESIATTQMQNISRAAITALNTNGNISAAFANMLRADIANKSTDLYKTVTCRNDCEDYVGLYYNNGKYYQVKVTHNETDKYNEIVITSGDTFESMANELYDENIVTSIKNNLEVEGSLLNEAITNYSEYNEIYFNTTSNEYLAVKIKPNNTYKVNSIEIDFYDDISVIEDIYDTNLVDSIMVSYNEGNLSNIEYYSTDNKLYDLHYINGEYYLMKINFDENGCNSFIIYNDSIETLLEKISDNKTFGVYVLKTDVSIINNLISSHNGYTKVGSDISSNTNIDYVIINIKKDLSSISD